MDREVQERFERIEMTLALVAESQLRLQQTVGGLAESIGHYIDASEARIGRIEANLDALIRAITAEHGNGRSQ